MDTQTLLLIGTVLAALAVVLLIVLLARRVRQAALAEERDRLRTELQAERDARHEQTAALAREQERSAARESEIAALQERLRQGGERYDALLVEQRATQQAKSGAEAELADLRVRLEHGERAQVEMRAFLDHAQERLSATFTELAGKTFASTVDESAKRSREDIDLLLKPFAERIGEFRSRIDTLYGEEAKERATLAGKVDELKMLNQNMAERASELTQALRGNSRIRGDWGELMLESVLQGSGLVEGAHYEKQKSSTDDEGQRLRPDVVVLLPNQRRIVIDSKVNLVDWQDAMNAGTPEEQQEALRRHSIALRQHVRELGDKDYPKALGDDALEITVAFVPIEGALSAALGFDAALQTFAFDKKIVLASPNTLMAVLRVVDRLWTRDKLQREAAEIAKLGGYLLDSLINFLADFDNVGRKLDDARSAFNDARGKLSESNQALIPRARRLAQLGAKGKKALPAELQSDVESFARLGLDDDADAPRD